MRTEDSLSPHCLCLPTDIFCKNSEAYSELNEDCDTHLEDTRSHPQYGSWRATQALQVVATWQRWSGRDMISSLEVTSKLLGLFSLPLVILILSIGSPYFKTCSSSINIGCWGDFTSPVLSFVLTIFNICPWNKVFFEFWIFNKNPYLISSNKENVIYLAISSLYLRIYSNLSPLAGISINTVNQIS